MKKLIGWSLLFGICLRLVACKGVQTRDNSSSDSFMEQPLSGSDSFNVEIESSSLDEESSNLEEKSSSDEVKEEWVIITFQQDGCDDIVKKIKKGETLIDIPVVQKKTGYSVTWETSNFTNITKDIIVKAVEIAKKFTVTLDANGGTVSPKTITVTYGQTYEIPTPIHEEKEFNSWSYKDKKISSKGVWAIDVEDEEILFIAQWGEYEWSGNY